MLHYEKKTTLGHVSVCNKKCRTCCILTENNHNDNHWYLMHMLQLDKTQSLRILFHGTYCVFTVMEYCLDADFDPVRGATYRWKFVPGGHVAFWKLTPHIIHKQKGQYEVHGLFRLVVGQIIIQILIKKKQFGFLLKITRPWNYSTTFFLDSAKNVKQITKQKLTFNIIQSKMYWRP